MHVESKHTDFSKFKNSMFGKSMLLETIFEFDECVTSASYSLCVLYNFDSCVK